MECIMICEAIFNTLHTLLRSGDFQAAYRVGNCFTRERKLNFERLFFFLLRQFQKSLPICILEFLKEVPAPSIPSFSKQAVSKARKGICVQAFAELVAITCLVFYRKSNCLRTWQGFQVLAIDGTSLQMPQTKQNLAEFGSSTNQTGCHFAMAAASILFDTLNDIILDAQVHTCNYSEREMALKHLDALSTLDIPIPQVLVLDRGYPSIEFCQHLANKGYLFVMRVKKSSSFVKKMTGDDICTDFGPVYPKGAQVHIRALRIPLETGESEYLITNIFDPGITLAMFGELYFLRWKIETKYGELKSRLNIEAFSGNSPLAVRQDFYISVFLSNLVSIIKRDADRQIAEATRERSSKYRYQSNRGMIINRLKAHLLEFLWELGDSKRIWEDILTAAIKTRSQIRPNRKYERKLGQSRRKHPHNRKPC